MRKLLIELRKKMGKTQEDVATSLGISRQHYSRIELGERNPSYPLSLKIKEYFNYQRDDIFFNIKCDEMERQ